ncbi:ABC transporter ATP-binding protein [Kallotenue papyrolyticum]|uniref:ABC transporter ATP-binding protein n=1 Tax=Kallotenue papyrolyticum TaxID=1325125 RepID=UPI0004922E0D|nr:ABC transporter ATP-binding protein [Kallotenue papyrolyticum]
MHPDNDEAAIVLDRLSKWFDEGAGRRVVLREVSATFRQGEFVVLLGKSGSGKSTLLNLIGGIDTPSGGTIRFGDQELTAMDERARTLFRRRHIGFIFQFFNLLPTLTVLENVLLPLELNGRADAAGRQRALDLLAQVELRDRANAFPDKLSGGEQQRVAIARALAHDPLLILADEPTGNLDYETGRQVLELLDTLTRRAGKNLVMVTHSPDVVGIADRIFHMRDGMLIEEQTLGAPRAAALATQER